MYIPTPFRESRLEVMHELIRAHPLGLLVTGGPGGLAASQVPFLVYAGEGEHGILRAHMARANGQWRSLQDGAECMVVFQGGQGYVSPSWYPSKALDHEVVPTWNYVTVHAWGRPRVVEDSAWLHLQLEDLTRSQEQQRARPWAVGDAPDAFIARQMQAILGIEIAIARIEGKWKLSQNRLDADRAGVIAGMTAEGDAHRNPQLAELVAQRQREGASQ
jgi:transcriptional regulator